MSEKATFTPGPWAIGIETTEERAQVIAADGSHIAYVECDPVPANARLIAKAPELYAALCGFANVRDEGRCASCNAEVAPEGYCGCAESVSGIVEWENIRAARRLLAEVRGDV